MDKGINRVITVTFIALVIILIVIGIIAYKSGVKYLTYNGKSSLESNVTLENIESGLSEKLVVLKDGDKTYKYTYKEIGLHPDWTNGQKLLINSSIKLNLDTMNIKFGTNEKFDDVLNGLNKDRYDNKYASIEVENGEFVVSEERHGNKLDIELLHKDLLSKADKNGVELDLTDYILQFNENMPKKSDLQKEVEEFNSFGVTYQNGYVFKGKDIIDYLKLENNKIVFNEDLRDDALKHIRKIAQAGLNEYDTVGGNWNFVTSSGESIVVSGGTWGDYFSAAGEAEHLLNKFSRLESEYNRAPIKRQDYPDEIPSTYVEVSIDNQHLWYYRDSELVTESDVVTGTLGKNDTPRGVYFISEKINGKNLRGEDYVTWVNKWMRITNRGHGLHDAYWRDAFGGDIYMTNGSHGCVNLPKDFAYTLYDLVNVNDCVVIY